MILKLDFDIKVDWSSWLNNHVRLEHLPILKKNSSGQKKGSSRIYVGKMG